MSYVADILTPVFFFQLEDLEITLADQVQKVWKGNWGAAWEEAGGSFCELEDTYALTNMSSLEEATSNVISFLGLQPADRSERVPEGRSSHTLYLAG